MLALNQVVFGNLQRPEGANPQRYSLLHDDRYRLYRHALDFYDVPGRFYHDELHVDNMLDAYAKYFKHSMSDGLFVATIMHDAVYIPGQSPLSEEASMRLVPTLYAQVIGKPIPQSLCDEVFGLIRWTLPATHVQDKTESFKEPHNREAAILLDLDLSGMSNPVWSQFIETQQNIDKEFSHLGTMEERRIASANFLNTFVAKGFVYYTEEMTVHNAKALQNLRAFATEVLVNKNYDLDRMKTFTRYDMRI